MFINFSNHPSSAWSKTQLAAAKQYGEIKDIPFPSVSPTLSAEQTKALAQQYINEIISLQPTCTMIQGEFTFVHYVVNKLKEHNIKCVAACTERIVKEEGNKKISEFSFVQFREYF